MASSTIVGKRKVRGSSDVVHRNSAPVSSPAVSGASCVKETTGANECPVKSTRSRRAVRRMDGTGAWSIVGGLIILIVVIMVLWEPGDDGYLDPVEVLDNAASLENTHIEVRGIVENLTINSTGMVMDLSLDGVSLHVIYSGPPVDNMVEGKECAVEGTLERMGTGHVLHAVTITVGCPSRY